MNSLKLLIVTLPNDLGSRTIEANLIKLLSPSCDLKVFRFAAQIAEEIDAGINRRRGLWMRIRNAFALRKAVRNAVKDGRSILFYNVSTAMFAYGCWRGGKAYITMDWAGKLFNPEPAGIRTIVGRLNRIVFLSCNRLLPMTQSMALCLEHDYRIPKKLIYMVPSLFDVDHFDPGTIQMSDRLRVLFVGGDIQRKGGDLLYHAFREYLHQKCELTMATNAEFPPCEGLTLRKGIRYGSCEHLEMMRAHDVLILPTRQDSGPQVIGEAAASGLAVVTTRMALGAPHVIRHGVNGLITESPEQCIAELDRLLDTPVRIKEMREASLAHMKNHYSSDQISSAYLSAMSG